jgi:hypothetical protein
MDSTKNFGGFLFFPWVKEDGNVFGGGKWQAAQLGTETEELVGGEGGTCRGFDVTFEKTEQHTAT